MFHNRQSARRAAQICSASAVLLTFALGGGASAALDLSSPERAAGQWDISLANSNRRCRITLRPEIIGQGYAVSMPAGCRRALPILAAVGAWTVPRSQTLSLEAAQGKTVLEFEPAPSGETLAATGPDGETYALTAAGATLVAQNAKPAPLPATPAPGFTSPAPGAAAKPTAPVAAVATPAKPPSAAAAALKISDVAGRYNVFREGSKDTGCMLTLDEKAPGLKGNKAQLAPACRDQGLVIFDPAGWALEKGRLVLTARKGHQTHLDLQPDGIWYKDPKEGKALSVKKF